MKKRFLSLSVSLMLAIVLSQCSQPKYANIDVQSKLDSLVSAFHGTAGVYARNLATGETFAVNADTIFPTASMIKVAIAVGIFKKIEEGEYTYHQKMLYRDSMAYGGSGIMHNFKDSTEIQLSKIITLMLGRSDNTAAVWCQRLAGGDKAINAWLVNHGFKYIRDNSGAPDEANGALDRKKAYSEYGWGQTTPREITRLLTMIWDDKVISPAASERIFRDLSRNYWDDGVLFEIPPAVHVATKGGAVNAARSEVALVDAPDGPYVFYVGTKNIEDRSWKPTNEANQLKRDVSKLLWNYFEPQSNWQPPKGAKTYWK